MRHPTDIPRGRTDVLADFVAADPRPRMRRVVQIFVGLIVKAFLAGALLGAAVTWAVSR